MPLISTLGAASSRGFGQFNQGEGKLYVEDVFSTWLYTGTGASQTITNGIDLAGKGGLVWTKARNLAYLHSLIDTVRGGNNLLFSNATSAQTTYSNVITSFNSTGYSLGTDSAGYNNDPTGTFASWTFRKAPKFFDVVTWSGNSTNRTISHSLGSVPGMIIVKRTDSAADWQVYHRSLANTEYVVLNTTAAKATGTTRWNSTTATDTVFSLGTDSTVNATGGSYVAYLFAHDTTADGIVQCGSYTGNGSTTGPVVNLGYEPQFVIAKAASTTGDWFMADVMRGQGVQGSTSNQLKANTTGAEELSNFIAINSTGFQLTASVVDKNGSGQTYVYLAIRRGPMRTPTSGTSVFAPYKQSTGTGSVTVNYGITPDLVISKKYNGSPGSGNPNYTVYFDRLRGSYRVLYEDSNPAAAEFSSNTTLAFDTQNGAILGTDTPKYVAASFSYMHYPFVRAPKFFDTVCYTGTGSAQNITHNLGAVPQLILIKSRGNATTWYAYANLFGPSYYFIYNGTLGVQSASSIIWNSTSPTSSVFSVGSYSEVNGSGDTFVAHLFGSCPGVSSIGTYTGTGSTQTINCGFTGGARFVMIKRTDNSSDWNVLDTTRGMVAGADYYIPFYDTAAQTNANNVYTTTSGFQLVSADANFNANGGTYLYLAIA